MGEVSDCLATLVVFVAPLCQLLLGRKDWQAMCELSNPACGPRPVSSNERRRWPPLGVFAHTTAAFVISLPLSPSRPGIVPFRTAHLVSAVRLFGATPAVRHVCPVRLLRIYG